ncbi:protein spindle-F [Anopheles funestus]|uniref:Zn-C2H2_12 domain-containing protein n=1 Tax=Anopheles funestus TaxID=62324 RepID=A0A182RH78_ANOFN|nr:protein spindle-F [Anopheles funestus]
MSIVEPNTQTASNQALQTALQTLKERCQTFQRRITILEEENGTLRARQVKSTIPEQLHDNRAVIQTELMQLRETVAELTHQKMQMAEQISMVGTENRQLWRRLSLIAKNLGDVDGVNVGPSATTVNQQQRAPPPPTSSSTNQTGQNLIRSRTFTKHAPNPKLRERLQRDNSAEEKGINLEDISLLNTCGFLETSNVDPVQDEELLRAALEANPDISRCTEGLLDIEKEIARQQAVMWDLYHVIRSELCQRCSTKSSETESEKLMKDVMVEVVENELAPRKSTLLYPPPVASKGSQSRVESGPGHCADALMFDKVSMNLLQEKLRANGMKKICPMCGLLYGQETVFEEFQTHVESHFLHDGELDELSLDRTYEYTSQTVGDF